MSMPQSTAAIVQSTINHVGFSKPASLRSRYSLTDATTKDGNDRRTRQMKKKIKIPQEHQNMPTSFAGSCFNSANCYNA